MTKEQYRRPQDETVLRSCGFVHKPLLTLTSHRVCNFGGHLPSSRLEVGEILLKRGKVEGVIIESQRGATSAECINSA